jgi:hypothetical protein
MPDWMDVPITTFTWMIMPELEEFLSKNSNILTFKSLFDIDYMDYEQNWYMGRIFPGYSKADENLPEKSLELQKGHFVLDRVYKVDFTE